MSLYRRRPHAYNGLLATLDVDLASGRDLKGTDVCLELTSLEIEEGLQ